MSFLRDILKHDKFLEGDFDTNFIPKHSSELFEEPSGEEKGRRAALALALRCALEQSGSKDSAWGRSDGFRGAGLSYVRQIKVGLEDEEVEEVEVQYLRQGGGVRMVNGGEVARILSLSSGSEFEAEVGGEMIRGEVVVSPGSIHVWTASGERFIASFPSPDHEDVEDGSSSVTSPMPGRVVQVFKKDGEEVKKGDPILAIEAMKMELLVSATTTGVLSGLKVSKDSKVGEGAVLAYIVDPAAAA